MRASYNTISSDTTSVTLTPVITILGGLSMRLWSILLFVACFLAVSLAPLLAGGGDPLVKYHLTSGEIAHLNRIEDSHLYGKGQELTSIYDGGVNKYLKAGVVEASQYYYTRGRNSAEMVVLHLKSAKHAQAFYSQWKKEMGKGYTAIQFSKSQPASGVTYVQQGATYGFACVNAYMITTTLDCKDANLAADMMKRSVAKILH